VHSRAPSSHFCAGGRDSPGVPWAGSSRPGPSLSASLIAIAPSCSGARHCSSPRPAPRDDCRLAVGPRHREYQLLSAVGALIHASVPCSAGAAFYWYWSSCSYRKQPFARRGPPEIALNAGSALVVDTSPSFAVRVQTGRLCVFRPRPLPLRRAAQEGTPFPVVSPGQEEHAIALVQQSE
jgi:hypothetical protein